MDDDFDRDYLRRRSSFRDDPRTESSLADVVDLAARRFLLSMLVVGGAISLAIYSRPGPPRYQAFETETGIVRVDTRSGTVLHCVANGCYTVVRRGQSLLNQSERQKAREKAYGDVAPPTQKALPAPQSAPAEQPAQPVQPAQPEPASQR